MKTSTAIFGLGTLVIALSPALATNAWAQVPVYQTIQNAPVVPAAPIVPAAPVALVSHRVYVASSSSPVYVTPAPPVVVAPYIDPPIVYFAPPAVSVGFGFGGCAPGFGWGVGFSFGPRYWW
jgi:hypothetical protein